MITPINRRKATMSNEPLKYQNLSRHQYGDLRFIAHNHVTMAHLRNLHMGTLTSLAYRGYLKRTGTTEDAEIVLTPIGEEALRIYEQAGANERQHEADVTERCLLLLKHSRRIVTLTKSA